MRLLNWQNCLCIELKKRIIYELFSKSVVKLDHVVFCGRDPIVWGYSLGALRAPALKAVGMPPELLPLALIRPFSGSASTGMMAELIHAHGGNSLISKTAATMMGSTETTFYVIAVYFGAVNIRRTRHAIPAGLLADFAGIVAAVLICRYLY